MFPDVLRLCVLLLLALAGGLVGIGSAPAAESFKAGEVLPDLGRYGLEGKLPDMKGKVVLLDFFASWCGPCKDSFPVMEELHRKYGGKGLVVVAVNLDEKASDMEGFLKKHPSTFAIVRDGSNKLVEAAKIKTMPSSFLVDKEGRIHAVHRGYKGEETRKKYVEEIEALLK